MVFALSIAVAGLACATDGAESLKAGKGGGGKAFRATAYEYNISASPQVHSSSFDCSVKFVEQGLVKVIEVRNFLKGSAAPDVIVRIVASANSVGSVIYNAKGEAVAEYPNGELVNGNLFIFKAGTEKRKVSGRWYVDLDYLMSDFTITDDLGTELYKETVIYQAKSPSRK